MVLAVVVGGAVGVVYFAGQPRAAVSTVTPTPTRAPTALSTGEARPGIEMGQRATANGISFTIADMTLRADGALTVRASITNNDTKDFLADPVHFWATARAHGHDCSQDLAGTDDIRIWGRPTVHAGGTITFRLGFRCSSVVGSSSRPVLVYVSTPYPSRPFTFVGFPS